MQTETAPLQIVTVPFNNVLIGPETLTRIWSYVLAVKTEISWIGEVRFIDETRQISVLPTQNVVEQTNSMVRTAMDANALAPLVTQYIREGRSPTLLRLWGHSHGPMDAYFSDTDERTIAQLSKNMTGNNALFVAVCANNDGMTYWRAMLNGFSLDWRYSIPMALKPSRDAVKQMAAEVKPKMKEDKGWGGRVFGEWSEHRIKGTKRGGKYEIDDDWLDRWGPHDYKIDKKLGGGVDGV